MGEKSKSFLYRMFTLEPVHIGTGQDIMGEVDLPTDREEDTKVPRIPGTTLKGAYRANAKWKLVMDGLMDSNMVCLGDSPAEAEEAIGATPETTGMGDKKTDSPSGEVPKTCGIENCPICQTFGWPSLGKDSQKPGREGRVFFQDARIAFFPAVTNHGTLWFSTPGRAASYLGIGKECADDPILKSYPELLFGGGEFFAAGHEIKNSNIYVSWIHISGIPNNRETIGNEVLKMVIDKIENPNDPVFPTKPLWEYVKERIVLLDEKTFYRVVESCLERRTCNKIDELTGTVTEKALFSYEAIPRNTFLYSRIECSVSKITFEANGVEREYSTWEICNLAREGLARRGIGGLQTRGLGCILVEKLSDPPLAPAS